MRTLCFSIPAAIALMATWSIRNLNAAGTWDDVAARFECGQKIQEGEQGNGSLYQIEYLPRGEKIGAHSRIFTVTLTRLSQEESAANEQAEKFIKSVAASSSRAATKIIEFNRYSTNHGPVAFFEYTLKGEHNLGVIARTGPGMLAVYQLATFRGQQPKAEDRKGLRAMIGLN